MSVIRRLLSVTAFSLLMGLVSAILCYWAAGASLGLFLGGLFVVTILTPAVTMAEVGWDRLIGVGAVVVSVSGVWLVGTFHSEAYVSEWVFCSVVLEAYAIGLAGLAAGLRWARCSAVVAAGVTVIAGLVWMTWPIWLSPTWNGSDSEAGVARLVMLHPGMVVNGQVSKLGAWSGQSVAYHLTDLQQNVMYSLPHSIWPCVLLHALLGGGLLWLASVVPARDRSRSRSGVINHTLRAGAGGEDVAVD
jgi:hypothetical protein